MPLPKDPEQVKLSIGEHLDELRSRVIKCLVGTAVLFIACFYFSDRIMVAFLHPVLVALEDLGLSGFVIFTSIQEKFMAHVKVSGVAALLVASPLWAYQAWQFVGVGLYPHERRFALVFVPITVLNFFTGVGFCYFLVMPWGIRFLLGFGGPSGGPDPIQPFIKISEILSFFITLSVVFGVVFETPLVMLGLSRLGIFTPADYAGKRKFAILVAFVLGAVLTPSPDVFSQVALAVPLLGLYEIGIIVSRFGAVATDERGKVRIEWRGLGAILLPTLVVCGIVVWRALGILEEKPREPEPFRPGGAASALLADLGGGEFDAGGRDAPDPLVRYRALGTLVAAGAEDGELEPFLGDADPGVRLRAAGELARRGRRVGFQRLLDDLGGPDPLAAWLAGRVLHSLHPEVDLPAYGAGRDERLDAGEAWRRWWDARSVLSGPSRRTAEGTIMT